MNIVQEARDLLMDVGVVHEDLHKLDRTAKTLTKTLQQLTNVLYLAKAIINREGGIVKGDTDIPRALEAVIAKLKEPSPTSDNTSCETQESPDATP